jgi:hypothetical protein
MPFGVSTLLPAEFVIFVLSAEYIIILFICSTNTEKTDCEALSGMSSYSRRFISISAIPSIPPAQIGPL